MSDTYPNFVALASAEPAGVYAIAVQNTGSSLVVAAPHGGGIEPGTSEVARAIAGGDLSFYLFEGNKLQGNKVLHITSSNFDEPQCIALLSAATNVVTIHGEDSTSEVVYVGGRCKSAFAALRAELEPHGFTVGEHSDPGLQGLHPRNICNIGRSGAGVQLELSLGLRESFFQSLSRTGRKSPTPRLFQFSNLVRQALLRNGL